MKVMGILDVYGTRFLKCEKEDREWNIGCTPHDLNRFGLEFTCRIGAGVRVCNFGCKALAHGKGIDNQCPHRAELCDLLGEDDASPQCRIWGSIDPEVARRALRAEPD